MRLGFMRWIDYTFRSVDGKRVYAERVGQEICPIPLRAR
jgi:hypothetical protein